MPATLAAPAAAGPSTSPSPSTSRTRTPSPSAPPPLTRPSGGGLSRTHSFGSNASSTSSRPRSDYSFGEDADRRPTSVMGRSRTGGIDFGQPLLPPSPAVVVKPSPAPLSPSTSQPASGLPRARNSSTAAARSGGEGGSSRRSSGGAFGGSSAAVARRRKGSSGPSWMVPDRNGSADGISSGLDPRRPSWGTGAAGGGLWTAAGNVEGSTSSHGRSGHTGGSSSPSGGSSRRELATVSKRMSTLSRSSGGGGGQRTSVASSSSGGGGGPNSPRTTAYSPSTGSSPQGQRRSFRMSTGPREPPLSPSASAHPFSSSPNHQQQQQQRRDQQRPVSNASSLMHDYRLSSGSGGSGGSGGGGSSHPYANPALADPSGPNRFSRSAYTPGSGSQRYSAGSSAASPAGGGSNALSTSGTPYTVYQPQQTMSYRPVDALDEGPELGDRWEGGESEAFASRRASVETASLASFTASTTSEDDDLLRQEALRRPSWVSIRLPSFASAATSRTNSTASTITSGLSPRLDQIDSALSSSFVESGPVVPPPPPTSRAQSSPILPMSASPSRLPGRRAPPPPITTTAASPDEALRSPFSNSHSQNDDDDVPPPVPSKLGLPSERTLTNISELGRSASLSSNSSILPALPARSPLRAARRGTPGSSPTASGESSNGLTTAVESDGSSHEGRAPSPAAAAAGYTGATAAGSPGEFGESPTGGVDLSTARPRRVSRHRPKTADDALPSSSSSMMSSSTRWSNTPPGSARVSQWSASDEGAIRLDDDGGVEGGERPARMSRSRPLSTSSRSSGSLVGGVRDPQMRKKREARVISVEEEEAVIAQTSSYGELGRSANGSANGPVETARSPSLPLHAATSTVPDLQLPQIPMGTAAFPSHDRSPPSPARSSSRLSAHQPSHQRSNSQPLPMLVAGAAGSSASPAPITSKRAHLLHEISTTERSYAADLALVRDAYLFRIRPSSQTESTTTTDGNTTLPTTSGSNRSSMATVDTAHTSVEGGTDDGRGDRKSKFSTSSSTDRSSPSNESASQSTVSLTGPGLGVDIPPDRSSAASTAPSLNGISASPSSYFPSPTSPRPVTVGSQHSFGSGHGPAPPPTIRLPLSPADVRAVFLNLEAVAALAHEFASLLEAACSPAAEEAGRDMIGEIFLTMMPRIRQAYTSYCPRQAGAHARFLELFVDRRYASYFAESWAMIQPHTNSWDLPSMLIKPVQRVLKYPLLLDDLLKQTPASHPDHANLKRAAMTVRSLADEINEIKRRKDTVDSIMHRSRDAPGPTGGSQPAKDKSKRGGVMTSFRKDRAKGPSSSASAATASAMSFTASSHEDLRKTETAYAALVSRLMTAETTAKRLGKAVASTGPRARESWVAQRKALDSWRRIINLGGIEPVEDIRIEAFRAVVEQVLQGPCVAMERELQSEIVPAFIKLFAVCKGPRTVILKRNANHEDYNRVIITKARGGDVDRLPQEVLEGAQVLVALHHQLLAELPPLLEGFATILDLVLKALAACHARFHRRVQDLLAGFWNEFPPVVMDVDSESAQISSDGPAIIRVWEEASRVPTEMVEELAITRKISVRLLDAPVRLASGSVNKIHEGIVERSRAPPQAASSRSNSIKSRPSPGGLSRQLSSSRHGAHTSSPSEKHLSSRSSSKLDLTAANHAPPQQPTPPSAGLDCRSSARAIPQRPTRDDLVAGSVSSVASIGPALSQMSFEGSDASNHEHFAESVIRRLSQAHEPDAVASLDAEGRPVETTPTKGPASALPEVDDGASASDVDAEWDELGADAEVLYRCECVADFDLQGLELQYMGHQFLKIGRGDVVEILFEVGRVDELDDFPLDVGLEDDGLLIAKDGAGTQGFVLCSFLHPIFDEDEEA